MRSIISRTGLDCLVSHGLILLVHCTSDPSQPFQPCKHLTKIKPYTIFCTFVSIFTHFLIHFFTFYTVCTSLLLEYGIPPAPVTEKTDVMVLAPVMVLVYVKGRERRSQAGPKGQKGRQLEVGARRAPRPLVSLIFNIVHRTQV